MPEPQPLSINERILADVHERLVNVEGKINRLGLANGINFEPGAQIAFPEYESYIGSPDQVFGNVTFAQSGEDLIVINLFRQLGIMRPSYLDIGAHHPLNISNTALLYRFGSRGVNVEANPNLMQAFQQLRPDDTNVNVGVSDKRGVLTFYMIDDLSGRNTFDRDAAENFVRENPQFRISKSVEINVVTLDDIVRDHCASRYPDFLTIDVEGMDAQILRSADFSNSKPTIICVETEVGETSTSDAVAQIVRDKGYYLFMKTHGNGIFVDAAHNVGR